MKRIERKSVRLDRVRLMHEMSAAKTPGIPRAKVLPDKRRRNAERLWRNLARKIASDFGEMID
jgi:hypothetical protein